MVVNHSNEHLVSQSTDTARQSKVKTPQEGRQGHAEVEQHSLGSGFTSLRQVRAEKRGTQRVANSNTKPLFLCYKT